MKRDEDEDFLGGPGHPRTCNLPMIGPVRPGSRSRVPTSSPTCRYRQRTCRTSPSGGVDPSAESAGETMLRQIIVGSPAWE